MNILGNVVEHYVLLSFVLFTIGSIGFLVRRNVLTQLMSIELMLNAVNLTLVAFNRRHAGDMNGQAFSFFIIAVAAAEERMVPRRPESESIRMNGPSDRVSSGDIASAASMD